MFRTKVQGLHKEAYSIDTPALEGKDPQGGGGQLAACLWLAISATDRVVLAQLTVISSKQYTV